MSARYILGIDLGTTHTALAFADATDPSSRIEVFRVPQLVSLGALEDKPLLPSFLYFANASERALALPWDKKRTFAVGELARARGADSPARVVASAKSWLCHPTLDRRTGILPLGAPDDVEKISPVEVSWRFLEHLSEAWDAEHPDAPFVAQDVVITVPASFDAGARELTVEAALAAGIDSLTLLEEPQAALYAWIDARGDAWRRDLRAGDVVLVVDVGGGTTDFSAIAAVEKDGSLELERVAVGDHILLGGDNMDLALAYLAKKKLEDGGKSVDRWQTSALVHACRAAKERLLGNDAAASVPVAIAGRGSSIVGGSLRVDLTRDEVASTITDGFFPVVASSARPAVRARTALTEVGLPYASDPAVTKHLAAFLARHELARPTALLLNGGVLKAPRLRERLIETIGSWCSADGAKGPRVLDGADLDLGVARGAVAFGLVKHGRGVRIRGGTARAYYVGFESSMPAVPGVDPPITALCVAPFGMEEGTVAAMPSDVLGAVVGENVRFRFFGSTTRRDDVAGAKLDAWTPGELDELPPIEMTLPTEGRREGDVVPVRLRAEVTPTGTLVLDAVPVAPRAPDERWRVELSVREAGTSRQ
jgi:molecular chaperone DnaK (HSP70)